VIHRVVDCPYCDPGAVGLDDERGDIVFNPDRGDPSPCPHLACFNICLDAHREREDGSWERVTPPTADWLWVRDVVPLRDCVRYPEHQDLVLYLERLFLGELPHQSLRPPGPYLAVGATAGRRENRQPGSGFFALPWGEGPPLEASLDGWAFFAPDPRRFVAALPDLVARWGKFSA
jgi:hypothetical protein